MDEDDACEKFQDPGAEVSGGEREAGEAGEGEGPIEQKGAVGEFKVAVGELPESEVAEAVEEVDRFLDDGVVQEQEPLAEGEGEEDEEDETKQRAGGGFRLLGGGLGQKAEAPGPPGEGGQEHKKDADAGPVMKADEVGVGDGGRDRDEIGKKKGGSKSNGKGRGDGQTTAGGEGSGGARQHCDDSSMEVEGGKGLGRAPWAGELGGRWNLRRFGWWKTCGGPVGGG